MSSPVQEVDRADGTVPIDYALIVPCPICDELHQEINCPPVGEPSRPEARR